MKNGIGIGIDYNSQLRGYGSPYFSADFAQNPSLPSSITFSRTSNATVTDSDGLIKYAPHNLLTDSESFDAATWIKANATVSANSTTAPNGTTTADKLVEDTLSAAHQVTFGGVSLDRAIARTISVYVKLDDRQGIRIQDNAFSSNFTRAFFNISTLTASTAVSGNGVASGATITDVGNGWYRCSYVSTPNTVSGGGSDVSIALIDTGTNFVYTGNGTSGIFLWGAQLTALPCVSNDYISTTPANLLGFTEEYDNAAWTKTNSFVQTNLLTYSEQFDNAAWTKTRSSITANVETAPNGTLTADKLVIDTTATTNHNTGQNQTVVSGVTYTFSVYAKAGEFSQINLRFNAQFPAGNTFFDLSNGTLLNAGTVVNSTITSVGNGWYRCTFTQTANASGTAQAQVFLAQGNSITIATANGTDSLYIFGAQVVQGSDAGEYTQTGASTAAVTYTDPFGVKYARKLVEDTTNGVHNIVQLPPAYVLGTPYTISFYAKAGERTTIDVRAANNLTLSGRAVFDLENGTVTSIIYGDAEIIDAGNGWYRCVVYATAVANASTSVQLYLNGGLTYTGDGTSGIYISGAQLSNSASLDPYVYNPTTAITSAAIYMPRFNYSSTGEAQGLLIEEQRTNLVTYSEVFENAAWIKSDVFPLANIKTSPNGTLTADKVTENTANNYHVTRQTFTAVNSSYAFSVYAKAGGRNRFAIRETTTSGNGAIFDVSTGTVVSNLVSGVGSIVSVGNGWYRCTMVSTETAGTRGFGIYLAPDTATTIAACSYTGDNTSGIFVWGAQVEAGAFPTSYIPTVASSVTRNADNASILGRNFASWYNQSEGTVYSSYQGSEGLTSRRIFSINDATNNNKIQGIASNGGGTASNYAEIVANGATQATLGASGAYTSSIQTNALGYQLDNVSHSKNGSAATTDTSALIPIVNRMEIGADLSINRLNGTIKSINYWPSRLTDAQLQAITS